MPAANRRADQHQRGDAGPLEVAPQALDRGAAPGEQRSDAGEEQQEQADGDHQAVEPVGIERDLFAGDGFGDHREQRAPEDREAACQQDQVVEQEAGFARDHAFQFAIRS